MTLSVAANRILTAPSCIKCSNDNRSFATPKALKIHLGIKERKQRAPKCCAEEKSRAAQARDTNVHAGFPPGFYFGAASSAYQVEGATKEGGRGPSIWDTFCEKYPEKIVDRSSGEPGSGSYYQYKKDVELLRELGANAYRFSISWARVLPTGHGEPNEEGIRYYKNLIDELKNNGIEPFVTIFHWDMPQALEDKYEGFLSENIVEDYKHFANVCFENFGGKVKHWITLNEPSNFSVFGYSTGIAAPGRCTPGLTSGENTYTCPAGDSLSEPYIVGHNLLLAHAEVVGLYRDKYQKQQGGKIGITLTTNWYEPYNDDTLDKEAQQRALEFNLGWFLDPLKYGDYPFSMRSLVGKRLPKFTEKESQKLKNSYDFIGINYYTSLYARNIAFEIDYQPKICTDDMRVETPDNKGGLPIGYAEGEDNWVKVYPRGLTDLLQYVKERYTNPEVYITENGVMEMREKLQKTSPPTPLIPNKELQDIYRSEYHSSHLHQLAESARKGVKVKGYFAWSLLDSFEWVFGYRSRFGLAYVNNDFPGSAGLSHDLVRVPKQSYHWYKWFLQIAKDPHHII